MQKTIDSLRIGKNIRSIRLANEMTQIEMGELLGYSERQIRRLETNGTYDINVINLIATTFDISALNILSSDGMFWLYRTYFLKLCYTNIKDVIGMDLEVELDKLLKIKTNGRDDTNSNHINYPYEATPYSVLQVLANSGYIRKKDKIIDFGCGKGRVSFNFLIVLRLA